MSGNFIVFRAYIYIPGALIRSNENNTNESNLYNAHNGAFNEITGHQHTGAPGDAPPIGPGSIDLAANYAWTGNHSWSAPGTATFNNGVTIFNGGIWNGRPVLVTPVIASFINAQHNHQSAAGGGTLDAAAIFTGILPVVRGGTGVNTSTGTGSVVLSISPTLVTPVIGDFTTAQHNHQNAAGGGTLDVAAIATGILPVVRGGTGVNTSTGTGSVVLNISPTLTTPVIGDFTTAQHNHQNAAGGGQLDINLATTGILAITRGGTGAVVAPGVNQIIYSDGTSYVGSPTFVWLNGTQRLGVGTAAPSTDVHVSKAGADVEVRVERTTTSGVARVSLIDGSATTTVQSDGTNGYWQVSRGNTYIRGDDTIDCLEYSSHSATSGFGSVRRYTGTLAGTRNVGGSFINFRIANNQWLSCEMLIGVAWNDGVNRQGSVKLFFDVFRNGAGVKGIGGAPGAANPIAFITGEITDTAPVGGQMFYSGYTAPNINGPIRLNAVSPSIGNLPVNFFTTNAINSQDYFTFSDGGTDIVNIAFTPAPGAPADNFRLVGELVTIINEYV